ncbi:MAG: creatininase family protein, partial [Kiloniellales bacterium]|nr:creatininase family protein [Kiloniellales bacterium]
TADWVREGIKVLHLGDYYSANGQIEALIAEGETELSIGSHAGIRDSSELMAVYPKGVRVDAVAEEGGDYGEETGVIGDPTKASATRGEKLLTLKVRAALAQLRREVPAQDLY